jgi:hypothetical protein
MVLQKFQIKVLGWPQSVFAALDKPEFNLGLSLRGQAYHVILLLL